MSYQAVQTLTIREQAIFPRARITERKRAPAKISCLLPPILLFCALLLQLCIRIEIIEQGYNVERLRSTALKKDAELRRLKLDLAFATTPKRMTDEAQSRLSMTLLTAERVRALGEER